MKITIAVVTFDPDASSLLRLAESLAVAVERTADLCTVDLVAIDNGNRVEWPSYGPKPMVLPSRGNIGFAAAANICWREAATERGAGAIVFANPDGAFHPDCLRELVETHRVHPGDLIEARQFPEEHPKTYDGATGSTSWCSGACLLVPTATLRELDGFDERFFLYMEDIDLSWRARLAGHGIRIAPRALFMHDVLDRSVSPRVQGLNLLAQRALAHKWNASGMREAAETELLRQGAFSTVEDMPLLGEQMPKTAAAWQTADFQNRAYFAAGRW